jgi:hypothetical protein
MCVRSGGVRKHKLREQVAQQEQPERFATDGGRLVSFCVQPGTPLLTLSWERLTEGDKRMGLVVSLILIAAGAIMRYAVTTQANGWNVNTAGMVLMVVGGIGAVLSILFWASWGGFSRTRQIDDGRTVVREREVERPL